jgi:hypothetical protein
MSRDKTDRSRFEVWTRDEGGGYRTAVSVRRMMDPRQGAEVVVETVGPRGGRYDWHGFRTYGDYARMRRGIQRDREVLDELERQLDQLELEQRGAA